MEGDGAIYQGLLAFASTLYIGYARVPKTICELRWKDKRLRAPAKLADVHANSWRLMRRFNSLVELDREAARLDAWRRFGIKVTVVSIVSGLIIGGFGHELGDERVGKWSGHDLQDLGWGWLFILPTVLWMYVGGRGSFGENALAQLEDE